MKTPPGNFVRHSTPLGEIVMEEREGKISRLLFANEFSPSVCEKNSALLANACRQLDEYFSGARKEFSLPLAPSGTPFQKRIWDELEKIPFGETASYKGIAARAGLANAVRAVGSACGKNPILFLIPCHRVISASGALGGFRAGLDAKKFLLKLENATETREKLAKSLRSRSAKSSLSATCRQ